MNIEKTTNFFGIDISSVNEVYTANVFGGVFYIHPSVIEENNGFEFPIHNCNVIRVVGNKFVVVPGEKTMRFFDVENTGGMIEDAYGCECIFYTTFDKEKWEERNVGVILICQKSQRPTIEWVDKDGRRWMSTIDENGIVSTIPNPNPPPQSSDED